MSQPKIVLIQGSLSANSKTALTLAVTQELLEKKGAKVELVDLHKVKMEFCDGRELKDYSQDLQQAYKTMSEADAYVVGMPVYCYSVSGPLKNFLDITCKAMAGKPVGVVCSAGGMGSYLASADLLKILGYEVEAIGVHPVVYAWSQDFADGKITNPKVTEKIEAMATKLLSLVK